MANFTGQPISESYQRVLQVDGGVIQDGLGNTVDATMNQSGDEQVSQNDKGASPMAEDRSKLINNDGY